MVLLSSLGLDHEWGVELYGKLLETGGGKERMTVYFKVRGKVRKWTKNSMIGL